MKLFRFNARVEEKLFLQLKAKLALQKTDITKWLVKAMKKEVGK